MIAEESTALAAVSPRRWPGGGLGFDRKWNLGWMHDTLGYLAGGRCTGGSTADG